MATFHGRYFSIVFVGRQNPQILNHDFLVTNNILPRGDLPFSELFANQPDEPFSQFFSTPVLTVIRYGPISLIVQEDRYQIKEEMFEDPALSTITGITRAYFEKLRHTPIQLGGINLNGIIRFNDMEDERTFDGLLGINRPNLTNLVGAMDHRTSITTESSWEKGLMQFRVTKLRSGSQEAEVNFNHEFSFDDFGDIDAFLSNLDATKTMCVKFSDMLKQLRVERAT